LFVVAGCALAAASCGCDSNAPIVGTVNTSNNPTPPPPSGIASPLAASSPSSTLSPAPLPLISVPPVDPLAPPPQTPRPLVFKVDPAQIQAVRDDVAKLNAAPFTGDFETLLRLQHPSVIQRAGGADKAVAAMRTNSEQLRARGAQVESFTFPEEPVFLRTTEREYVMVPTKKILNVGGERAEITSFHFGIRPLGDSEWTYLDGLQISSAKTIAGLFPDFPADFPLLVIAHKKL
jgi:hypothetical protein